MRTAIIVLLAIGLACAAAACFADEERQVTFRILLSAKETQRMQDWSGRAEVTAGKVLRVGKDYDGKNDIIHDDNSWTVVYGRMLAGNPSAQAPKKALLVTVSAEQEATVRFKTKAGDFEFRLAEAQKGPVERLDGNVRIELAQAGRGKGRKGEGGRGGADLPPAPTAGELKAEPISPSDRHGDWPAIAVTSDGAVWAAYIEWNNKDADRVVARRRPAGGAWSDAIELKDRNWEHYWPAVAGRGRDVLVVWSGRSEPDSPDKAANWDLFACQVSADGKPGPIQQLTTAPHSDFNVRAVADAAGNVTLVWQSFRNRRGDIYAKRLTGAKWTDEVRISPSEGNDWEPAVALDSRGVAWIVWDSYHTGDYNVYLRSWDGAKLGDVVAVTTEPEAQFHPSVAVDKQDRVWVAYDAAEQDWGKDYASSFRPGKGRSSGLHASRTLGVRVYANGRLSEPAGPLSKVLVGRMARFAELPHLAVDGAGTLWMVFRHWTLTKPHEIYHFYATKLDADGWATPWLLGNSAGQNTQHAGLTLAADGAILAAYSSDGRAPNVKPEGAVHALHYVSQITALPKGSSLSGVTLADIQKPPEAPAAALKQRVTTTVGSKTYHLMTGDCHRHTDIRGHSAVDGSVLDTYRYALDAAQLDYVGMGDHNQVQAGEWYDGLRDYHWWWQQKAADLYTTPPYFVGIFSYEHSLSTPAGHRNILHLLRGASLRVADRAKDSPDNLPPNLWKWVEANVLTQPGQKLVIVPHTFASGPLAEWNWPNAPFDCLLEIYQGARGSYEAWNLPVGEIRGRTQTNKTGHFAQDALAKGNRYGFVSFSDHGSTHNSFACVWAKQPTRRGILEGMLARRTFAATDDILLEVTLDGRMVGEEFKAKAAAPLKIVAKAPDLIQRVDVVKDGKYIYTKEPKSREFRGEFLDQSVKPGSCYYYVRVIQRDPDNPEGDPEMAWGSPFFVTYE